MNPHKTITTVEPAILYRQVLKLERCGRYQEALELISDNRDQPSVEIDLCSFGERDAAMLLLRFGSLVGFNGHIESIAGAQEHSKDILTDARDRFLQLGEPEMIAACENYLALAYWRTGEFREADLFLDEAFAHEIAPLCDSRLYSHVVRSLVLVSRKEHEANVAYCRSVLSDIRLSGDALFIASIYANLGISFKDLKRIPEALSYLNVARTFHKRARHQIYAATVDNNLALLYIQERRFGPAHESVDSAIGIYRRLKDKTREGSSLETKSQIYLAEQNFANAMRSIDRSIALLRKSENLAYLAESIMTRSRILLFDNNFTDAVTSLIEAVDITRQQSGESAAKELIVEFESALADSKRREVESTSENTSELELMIPSEIAAYSGYRGVWVNNRHLECVGIPSGSLAVTAADEIKRGDLVAVVENATSEVICGFYDAEFGIICLDLPPGDPQLFNEDEISVMGKIVGVCRNGKDADGKMVVEPLAL